MTEDDLKKAYQDLLDEMANSEYCEGLCDNSSLIGRLLAGKDAKSIRGLTLTGAYAFRREEAGKIYSIGLAAIAKRQKELFFTALDQVFSNILGTEVDHRKGATDEQ